MFVVEHVCVWLCVRAWVGWPSGVDGSVFVCLCVCQTFLSSGVCVCGVHVYCVAFDCLCGWVQVRLCELGGAHVSMCLFCVVCVCVSMGVVCVCACVCVCLCVSSQNATTVTFCSPQHVVMACGQQPTAVLGLRQPDLDVASDVHGSAV